MSVTCVTIGDEDVQYRVITGEGTSTVAIKHIHTLNKLKLHMGKYQCVPERHEVVTHIEGRNYNG